NARLDVVAQDRRPDEHHQVRLDSLGRARAEEPAETRNAAEPGHALLGLAQLIVDQPAEHEDLAVARRDRAAERAVVRDQVDRAAGAEMDARLLDLDAKLHAGAFVDLRRDAQARADRLALDRLERIDRAVRSSRGGERSGEER